jgi:hypothetical protein
MVENVGFPFLNFELPLIRSGYCGNALNAGSVLAALTDCSFVCPGNQYEYCGAGNRLELYRNCHDRDNHKDFNYRILQLHIYSRWIRFRRVLG